MAGNDDDDAGNYGEDDNDNNVNGRHSLLLYCSINILKLDKFRYINCYVLTIWRLTRIYTSYPTANFQTLHFKCLLNK